MSQSGGLRETNRCVNCTMKVVRDVGVGWGVERKEGSTSILWSLCSVGGFLHQPHGGKSLTLSDYMAILVECTFVPFIVLSPTWSLFPCRLKNQQCATKYRHLIFLKLKIKLVFLPLFSLQQILKRYFSVIPLNSYIKVFKVFVDDWPALLTSLTCLHNHDKGGGCSCSYCYWPSAHSQIFPHCFSKWGPKRITLQFLTLQLIRFFPSSRKKKRNVKMILLIAGYKCRWLLLLLYLW